MQLSQHCQFVAQAGSVILTNTAGMWLKPAVLSCPTLLVQGSSRQCSLFHRCRFVAQADSDVCNNTAG